MWKFTSQLYMERKLLEYYLWDEEKARKILELRHALTTRGFEMYINLYLQKMWMNMTRYSSWNKADWWIDLRSIDNTIFVQCKKYFESSKNSEGKTWKGTVGISQLRDFFGWVISELLYNKKTNIAQYKKVTMMFFTTGYFTKPARDFAEQNNILLFDYNEILWILDIYTLSQFKKDYSFKSYYLKPKKLFDNKQIYMNLSLQSYKDSEVEFYLQQVRAHIVRKLWVNESKSRNIIDQQIIEKVAHYRIANFTELKNYFQEDHKDCLYAQEIVNAMHLLHCEV